MYIWTIVEQEMYNITGPFFWYQTEGACPLNKGSEESKVFEW